MERSLLIGDFHFSIIAHLPAAMSFNPPYSPFVANIHFIGGEKGGVGKSVVARVIAQYFIDHSLPFLGFDTDRSHGSLLRFYTDYASPVVVDQYESLDTIVEAASEQPDKRILVDLAAQTHEPLVKWMDDSGVLEAAGEAGLTLTYWHVMDSGRDSVDLLKKVLDRFGSRLNYILVLNQLRGDNFDIFEKVGREAACPVPSCTHRDLEASSRKCDQQDRCRQHQLLGGQKKECHRGDRTGHTGTSARESLAEPRLRAVGWTLSLSQREQGR